MKLAVQTDNTLYLPLDAICSHLNTICKHFHFTHEGGAVHFEGSYISCPASFVSLPNLPKKRNEYDYRIIFTATPYDNNFFYEEHESTIIVSSNNWNQLTDQPLVNGVYYFIASILASELNFGEDHYTNRGCINDVLVDKTGIDLAMRAASLCPACRRDLQKKGIDRSDLNSMLDYISRAARAGKSVVDVEVPPTEKQSIDLFLCHNSKDKNEVREVNQAMKDHGVRTWFDEDDLKPGDDWQEVIQEMIPQVKAAAVFSGKSGLGPWHRMEIKGLLSEFAEHGTRVIPVILPSAKEIPQLPMFLKQLTWLDLRSDREKRILRLVEILRMPNKPPQTNS